TRRPAAEPIRPRRPDRADERREAKVTRIYGFHSVAAALKAPRRELIRLYATPAAAERLSADIAARGLETRIMSLEEISARAPREAVHQGLLLEARPLAPIDVADLPVNGLVLVLDQITDPHNVGAILRTGAAFAVDALVTTDRHSPDFAGALAKSASGGLDSIRTRPSDSPTQRCHARSLWCWARKARALDGSRASDVIFSLASICPARSRASTSRTPAPLRLRSFMSDGPPKRKASVFAAAFFSLQGRHDFRVAQIVGLVEQRIERRAFGGVVDARPAGSRSRLRKGLCRRDARGGDVRRRRRRPIFGLARSLLGEHGRRERDRGDRLRSRSRRGGVGEGLAFWRTVVDARDDSAADLFDQLDARSGKRRQSRVLRVPIGADLG